MGSPMGGVDVPYVSKIRLRCKYFILKYFCDEMQELCLVTTITF